MQDLDKAIQENNVEAVKQSLKTNDPILYNLAIHTASEYGHVKIVRLLLSDSRVDPSVDDNWAIKIASQKGHTEIVQLLLSDLRVDPSADDNYAIRWASYNGYLKVVRLLLFDSRVDPSAIDSLAIRCASAKGHLEVVRLLLYDPRVNFNAIMYDEMKEQILKEERNKLKNELIFKYLSIAHASPQITFEGKQKSKIPQTILRKIAYEASYQEITLQVKLLALADLLKIEYNQNITYEELSGKVKLNLGFRPDDRNR